MSYDAPRPRRGEPGQADDPYAVHFRPRDPREGYQGRPGNGHHGGPRGYERDGVVGAPEYRGYRRPADGYRQEPRVARQPARPPERASSAGRGLLAACGAVVLMALSAGVTWVVAAHHFGKATSAAGAAQPETAAGALAAANTYFALYGAGQYGAVYPLITPADRAVIAEGVWTGLHQECKSPAAGLSYKVTHPVLSGQTAVMSVGFAGAASAIGSEQVTFTYAGGGWYYEVPNLQVYRGHTLAQAVAAAKAAGSC